VIAPSILESSQKFFPLKDGRIRESTPWHFSPEPTEIMLGNFHKRSTRSLSALADDFDPIHERNHGSHRSSSLGLYPANRSVQGPLQGNGNGIANSGAFDPFVTASTPLSAAGAVGPVSANPYAHDPTAALGGGAFFANQGGFQQPVRARHCVSCKLSAD
jgi:hypothetical protein